MKRLLLTITLLAAALAPLPLSAAGRTTLQLPGWMTSNMVLQQQTTLHLTATAKKNATVKVTTSWDGQTQRVKADAATGAFACDLRIPEAGGPFTITFDDGRKTVLENVMAGEVWFCSGQSNMEMPVKGWGKVTDYEKELADGHHPNVRLFQVERAVAHSPQTAVPIGHTQGWTECTPQMLEEFSAAAYFYARYLSEKLGVAVGVVNSSWGGTPAETWVSHEALKNVQGFGQQLARIEATGFDDRRIDSLYQADRKAWLGQFYGADQGLQDGDIQRPRWTDATTDDSTWKTMTLPTQWERAGLTAFDGVVWFRKVIDIPADLAGKELTLHLGKIDDSDITYWNGEKVAEGSGWTVARTYTVPARLVKAGRNILCVRVHDTGGEGGITGEPADLSLQVGTTTLPLAGEWRYRIGLDGRAMGEAPKSPSDSWYPSNLYNAMVAPFLGMPIRGIIWYQGCSNVGRAIQYESLFQTLIRDWQARFNPGAAAPLPFYFVQIANYRWQKDVQPESEWAAIREAQTKALKLDGVGMMVNITLGEAMDIHPKSKREVGRRLALLALNRTYGQPEPGCAPEYEGMSIAAGKAIVRFRPVPGSDVIAENADIKGFTIAGPDHRWHVARAHTEGNGRDLHVVVEAPEVPQPVAVRYGWADNPTCTLSTLTGLDVSPFRTDDWPDFR